MTLWNYYEDTRYCPRCQEYVRYLQSPQASYCVACGARVVLFSQEDRARFKRSVRSARTRNGAPSKRQVS